MSTCYQPASQPARAAASVRGQAAASVSAPHPVALSARTRRGGGLCAPPVAALREPLQGAHALLRRRGQELHRRSCPQRRLVLLAACACTHLIMIHDASYTAAQACLPLQHCTCAHVCVLPCDGVLASV